MKPALLALLSLFSCSDRPELVDVHKLDPSIVIDVKYATADNFLKKPVYPVARVLLRPGAAERLVRVQKRLRERGLGLKVFDGYRPLSVQKQMWAILPDDNYVADPKKGSKHNRGAAVDVTLVDASGKELVMPTAYDDFTEKAAPDWAGATPEAAENRRVLQEAMKAEGFLPIASEWWHFDAPDWQTYGILDHPLTD